MSAIWSRSYEFDPDMVADASQRLEMPVRHTPKRNIHMRKAVWKTRAEQVHLRILLAMDKVGADRLANLACVHRSALNGVESDGWRVSMRELSGLEMAARDIVPDVPVRLHIGDVHNFMCAQRRGFQTWMNGPGRPQFLAAMRDLGRRCPQFDGERARQRTNMLAHLLLAYRAQLHPAGAPADATGSR